ncbi:MAG: PP2C family protein-serine/threonine phosphatase [Bacteroidota bacterium]
MIKLFTLLAIMFVLILGHSSQSFGSAGRDELKKKSDIAEVSFDSISVVNLVAHAEDICETDAEKACRLSNRAYKMADSINDYHLMLRSKMLLYNVALNEKDYKEAYEILSFIKSLNDTIHLKTTEKQVTALEEKYNLKEIENKMKLFSYKEQINNLEISKGRRLIIFIWIFAALLILFISYGTYIYLSKKKKNKILQKKISLVDSQRKLLLYQKDQIKQINDELIRQIDLLQGQKDAVEIKNQQLEQTINELDYHNSQIVNSINFAQNIQKAAMPDEKKLKSVFHEYASFILARDLISGDFIWFYESDDYYFYAVADCTGHGVPGAMVSTIGMTLLNKIVAYNKCISTSVILKELHQGMLDAFHREDSDSLQITESIDISICRFDKNFENISYSGAKRPFIMFHGNEFVEIKGDRFSIGGIFKKKKVEFKEHHIKPKRPFTGFFFTDGVTDQMNPKGEKITYTRFKNYLKKNKSQDFDKLTDDLKNWLSNHQGDEIQTDDIVFSAFRIL